MRRGDDAKEPDGRSFNAAVSPRGTKIGFMTVDTILFPGDADGILNDAVFDLFQDDFSTGS